MSSTPKFLGFKRENKIIPDLELDSKESKEEVLNLHFIKLIAIFNIVIIP